MMKNKYPEGYLPKLRYWKEKLDTAANPHDKAQAASKMAYFLTRHLDTYGSLTPEEQEELNPSLPQA
jgi:hypothetical protein